MPLVRIDMRMGKDLTYRHEIGRVVYEDVFINLVDVRFENWSVGKGEARYAS